MNVVLITIRKYALPVGSVWICSASLKLLYPAYVLTLTLMSYFQNGSSPSRDATNLSFSFCIFFSRVPVSLTDSPVSEMHILCDWYEYSISWCVIIPFSWAGFPYTKDTVEMFITGSSGTPGGDGSKKYIYKSAQKFIYKGSTDVHECNLFVDEIH